nr:MAG TPA: hypothetical protein [Caudoviricetes sp.]
MAGPSESAKATEACGPTQEYRAVPRNQAPSIRARRRQVRPVRSVRHQLDIQHSAPTRSRNGGH